MLRTTIFFSSFAYLFIPSAILVNANIDKQNWVDPQSIEKMYNEYDLSTCPLFTGGFINFGYWKNQIDNEEISFTERLESEKNLYRWVLKKMEISSNDRILEVGCGLGLGSSLALAEFSPFEIKAIDFSKAQIERAKEMNYSHSQSKKIDYSIAKAEKIPYQNHFFEKVFSIEAAQHFSSLEAFVLESYRVLKPKGKLGIATFFAKSSESAKLMTPMIKTVEDGIDHLTPISDVFQMLHDSGFQNIKIESIGENVWSQFDKWIAQTEFNDTWDRNWYKGYQENLIDYYVITAEKPGKLQQILAQVFRKKIAHSQ